VLWCRLERVRPGLSCSALREFYAYSVSHDAPPGTPASREDRERELGGEPSFLPFSSVARLSSILRFPRRA